MKFKLLFVLIFTSSFGLQAQVYFSGMASKWSDDFAEWNIYTVLEYETPEEEEEAYENPDDIEPSGEMNMRWQMRNDWNTWDYTIGEERGYIRTLFTDKSDKWEVMGFNDEVITVRQIWAGDRREWRLTNNKIQLTFKSRYNHSLEEWMVRERNHGEFHIYTTWEGDPRDWTIVDEMDETISTPMKMAMIFIAIFNGTQ